MDIREFFNYNGYKRFFLITMDIRGFFNYNGYKRVF